MEQPIQPNQAQIADYFKIGFSLAINSWGLFLFGLSLSLLSSVPDLLGDSFVKGILRVMGFLLAFISIGFSFSLPVFLVDRQQRKSLTLGNILSTTLGNTKRLILPSIIILICLFVVMILSFFLIAQFIYGGNLNFMQDASTRGFNAWNLLIVLFIGLFSFLTFSPIYFSLEKSGLFSSIKKSLSLSFKNLNFIVILFVISASTYLALTLFLNNYQNLFQLFTRTVIYWFESILITATSLIFYQGHGGVGIPTLSVASSNKTETELQTEDEEYKKLLAPNERVVKVFDYADSQFIWNLVIGTLLIPLLFFGLIWILITIYRKLTLRYLVTDRRVIVKKGLIGQYMVSADYSKITDVTVQQGILGRLILHTGTIVVNTAGTDLGEVIVKWVEDPFEAKNVIYNQLHKSTT